MTSLAVLSVTASVLILILAVVVYGFVRVCLSARASALAEAEQLVDRHFAALDRLFEDPATPLLLLERAVEISERCANPEFAARFVFRVAEGSAFQASTEARDRARPTLNLLAELRSHRPDLHDAFGVLLMTGALAGAYRHLAVLISPPLAFKETRFIRGARGRSWAASDRLLPAFEEPIVGAGACVPA